MRKLLFCIVAFAAVNLCVGQDINITPWPSSVKVADGQFVIDKATAITAPDEFCAVAEYLSALLGKSSGYKPEILPKSRKGSINLRLDKSVASPEGYTLSVTGQGVDIAASSARGIFYGVQTLRQLLSADVEKFNANDEIKSWRVPCVEISDSPAMAWRGLMLDVSRTFMPKELVKRYIDLMAMYKMNTLHWHLTDDQGWRLEIDRYPMLTETGAKFDTTYNYMGGYYTKDDVREILSFAALRGVEIVPEIEMPGHVVAALASYPWLSCTGKAPVVHEFSAGPYVHEEIMCAGKPEVYEFLDGVLTEVAELFPSQYVHIGGDEAPKAQWKACPLCQKTMAEHNLKDEEHLQSYFVRRVGDMLRAKGKHLIGWDEIYDGGGLSGDELIMFWRGWEMKNLDKMINENFSVIMTPTTYCYFDYPYTASDCRKVYDYRPVPSGVSADKTGYFKGVQANFWSHIDKSEGRIDRQLFPRLLSLAEIGWTAPENLNWERFKGSAKNNIVRLKNRNVNVYDDKSLD